MTDNLDLLCLSEAARMLPSRRNGKRVHVSTLLRWVKSGRLRGWLQGGVWKVARADIERLCEPIPVGHKEPPPRTRMAEKRAAWKWLEAQGFKLQPLPGG